MKIGNKRHIRSFATTEQRHTQQESKPLHDTIPLIIDYTEATTEEGFKIELQNNIAKRKMKLYANKKRRVRKRGTRNRVRVRNAKAGKLESFFLLAPFIARHQNGSKIAAPYSGKMYLEIFICLNCSLIYSLTEDYRMRLHTGPMRQKTPKM